MTRGHRYYDPIVTPPGDHPDEVDLSRIELAQDESGKWFGRLIDRDGQVASQLPGDFDRETAALQATTAWPGLEVYEAREGEDTTWARSGPSPRVWGGAPPEMRPEAPVTEAPDSDGPPPLMVFPIEAGQYARTTQISALARFYADEYDRAGNPSAAVALRSFAEVLPE